MTDIKDRHAKVISRRLSGSEVVMKLGYFGKQNLFALEMLKRLKLQTGDMSPFLPLVFSRPTQAKTGIEWATGQADSASKLEDQLREFIHA